MHFPFDQAVWQPLFLFCWKGHPRTIFAQLVQENTSTKTIAPYLIEVGAGLQKPVYLHFPFDEVV